MNKILAFFRALFLALFPKKTVIKKPVKTVAFVRDLSIDTAVPDIPRLMTRKKVVYSSSHWKPTEPRAFGASKR